MSTSLEDRLSEALHARAELVQPEDLRHATLQPAGRARRPLLRRPAVVALVAAAAVAAIAVPLALRDHHTVDQPLHIDHHWPPAPHHPQPTARLTDHLSGDVDGDGTPDRVRLTGHTLALTPGGGSGHPVTTRLAAAGGLVGLADVGGAGRAILVSVDDLATGAEWEAVVLRHGRLRLQLVHSPGQSSSLSVVPGYWTSWLTPDGVAMTGRLDPVQDGARHLAVEVSRVDGSSGRPDLRPVGHWCWDVVTQDVPAPCPAGVDDAYDPGPRGSLPALLPRFDTERSIDTDQTWHDGSTSLHLEEGPVHAASAFHQAYDVVGTIDGHEVSAPAGVFDPVVYRTFVDLGHGVRGIVATSGPEPTWHVLAFVDGRLVPSAVHSPLSGLHPGVQSLPYRGRGEQAQTWIGPGGRVFTTVQTGGPGQEELLEWRVTDSSGATLAPVDLGRLCLDDFWGTYGTCRG